MPYEYTNPFYAGYYGHKGAQAEISDLESQTLYRDAQVREAEANRLAEMASAPYERRKLEREEIKGEVEMDKAEREYLVQNLGPLLAGAQRGDLPEMEFRSHIDNLIGQAASLFPMNEQEIQQMRTWGIPEWQLAYEQAQSYEQQTAAPPAPQDFMQGTETVQKVWDPSTRRLVPAGGGPRFAPPQAPGQKYGVLQNDRGQPTGFYEVGPDGNIVQMFPNEGGGPSLPGMSPGGPVPPGEVPGGPIPSAVDENLSKIADQLGPGPRIKEFISQRVAPLAGPLLGKGGSNPQRDAARSRYRAIRATIVDLNRIQGGRSNLYLGLAMEGLPETGVLESSERSKNVLQESFGNLANAFNAAMETYNDPNTPKAVAVEAYKQAVGIAGIFETMAQPLPGSSTGGTGRRPLSEFNR